MDPDRKPGATRAAIRDRALGLGFDVVGFAAAELGGDAGAGLADFIARGYHGDMGWLAARAGQRAAQVMAGVVLMLVVAALLEGFARQLVEDTPGRLVIGGFMLSFWLAYFFGLRQTAKGTPPA